MITVPPDGAAPAESAVDRPRHTDGEPPKAVAERPRVVGFDEEMEMVVLDTEVKEPEAAAGGRAESAAHGLKDPAGPQAADGPPGAESNVHRMGGGVRGPGAVRDAGAAARDGLAAGAGATAAPGAWRGKR